MFAPGVPELMKEFGSDNTLLSGFVVSVYVLGFAFGPLGMYSTIHIIQAPNDHC
jgi:MFS family permease